MTHIAFMGLGNMGMPMAANLSRAGRKVVGYDLSEEVRVRASKAGMTVALDPKQAMKEADVVITMLPAGKHVHMVWTGLIPLASAGTLFIDCSTIDVETSRACQQMAKAAGMLSLDAPVSGGTTGARAATLTFMVGGERNAYARGAPYLAHMGKKIVHCGDPGAGQAAKICNNMLLGISMVGVCEAFALAEKLGLSHKSLFDVSSTSSGQCWALTSNCPVPGPVPTSPANNHYKPGFAADLMLKDMLLAVEAAESVDADVPLGAKAAELYKQFQAAGHGGLDFSAIIEMMRGKMEAAGA